MKKKTTAQIISHNEIAPGIFDMWLETEIAKDAGAGQFIGVYTKDKSKLLPRPISICQAREDALRIVYRVSGEGTKDISSFAKGENVEILGILGNGYDLEAIAAKENVVLMGGGIGIPPMLELARELKAYTATGKENCSCKTISVVLGYRDSKFFLKDDFEKLTAITEGAKLQVYIATEDGSYATKGNVLDVMRSGSIPCEVICACGPMPMLRAIVAYAKECNAKAYISLEERMACGVGACLGCITRTKEIDAHSHVYNTRICTDGPVFDADVLDI